MSAELELPSGERGEALKLEGEVLHVVLPRAFAPGAPFRMRVLLADGPVDVDGKTIGSKRREDGRFDVRARLVSLRRTDRERLAALTG
jgi:hypothetical protein